MHNRVLSLVLALCFVLGGVSAAMALGGGNARKGKYLYRKNCRACHHQDGKAVELSPVSKLQKEWTAIFSDPSKLACAAEWKKLKAKDLNDIFTYLHDHAKDSPSPAKCK